jgi:hypothetical protein
MAKRIMMLVVLSLVLGVGGAIAEDDVIEMAFEACQPELETFCSQVTPGDGRLLACFFAHEDKVSGKCNWAIYQASVAVEEFFSAISHVATECHDDLLEYCGEVQMGEGRVGWCLLDHEEEVSASCRQAMKDVELEAVEE